MAKKERVAEAMDVREEKESGRGVDNGEVALLAIFTCPIFWGMGCPSSRAKMRMARYSRLRQQSCLLVLDYFILIY